MTERHEIARKIIAKGYFAKEIPCEFKTTKLSECIDELDLTQSNLSKKGLNKWCKLIDFSTPKSENFRRNLAVPHPLHYILLAQTIEKNWDSLNQHFLKSKFSLTTPAISEDNIIPKFSMSEKINKRIHNLVSKRYILQADITRYYPSIYTHSIPWALHTKEIAKAKQKDDTLLGNEIDKLLRNLQDGQTIGIPIGAVTSLVIQEIIGTAIDDEFKTEFGDNLVGYRYTDDMEYYFSSAEEAQRALNILNKILKNYELDLNNSKSRIVKIPQVLEPEWLYYFKKFEFRRNVKDNKQSAKLQHTDIKEFFSSAFKYKIQTDEKGILNYAVKVLRSVVIHKDNWDIFESLLLQSILVDSSIIPTVFETIEGYKYRGYPVKSERIEDFINTLIKNNIELKNDFEVSWALSFAAKLNIPIVAEVSMLLLRSDNPIINILTMILHSKSLLKGDLDFSYYKSLLTEDSLYDIQWLFYYECCIHRWLGKDENDPLVKEDKFFVQLLNHRISFVDPTYSIVLEELKKSIISLSIKRHRTDLKDLSATDLFSKIIEEYSFSLDDELMNELNETVEKEINLAEKTNEEAESTTDEGREEVKSTGEGREGVVSTDEGKEEAESTDEEVEETVSTQLVPREERQNSNNNWIFEFLTTNINKASKVRGVKIKEEY
ncbi:MULTISPECIES: RNA-directed DNA polymerase [unclassified Paenibacillus]|uniref:RNA-directed DNA polymerase n=1 Tax=unclassified Paenibacillus TaxID=185978 RepID=UPI0030F65EA3